MKKKDKVKRIGSLKILLKNYKESVLETSDDESTKYNKLLNNTIKYQTHTDIANFFILQYGNKYKKLNDYYLYFNKDNIWERDNDGTFIRNAISNELIKPYIKEIESNNKLYESGNLCDEEKDDIKKKNKTILKLINNLKDRGFKTAVFKEIGDNIKDNNFMEDMNKKINYLPIKNKKMLNIETLEIVERTEVYKFNYYCNVDYKELTTEEYLDIEEYFNKLFCDDYETRHIFINIIKTVFCGRILKNLFILVGDGSNGKSLLFDILKSIFGRAMMTLSTDIITVNKNKSSINSEFKKLEECRLGYITELENNDKLNAPLTKKITGNDIIDYRGLFQENRDLKPTSNLFVLTNELPKIPTNKDGKIDKAFLKRLITIEFKNHFDNDNTFVDRMMKKLDLIFSYIMRKGEIIKDVIMSDSMRECLKEYIDDNIKEDLLEEFINEYFNRVEILENEKWIYKSIKRDDFINLYEKYLEDNNKKNTLSKKKLTHTIKKNYKINSDESNSIKYFIGLVLKN
jgi:putative DNA primase/helicase